MKKLKLKKLNRPFALGGLAAACMAFAPAAHANDWNTSLGWWNDVANWNGGIPNDAGGWAIANVSNGGTAIITNTVPNVSEAWAGNGGAAGYIVVADGGVLNVDNWLVSGRTGGGGNTPLSRVTVSEGGVINKRGDGFIVGDDGSCKGEIVVTGNGRINVTGGWNGIGNGWTAGEGWLTLQDNAVYSILGPDWNVGDWGNGRGHALIKDNATLNVSRFWLGKWDNSIGALVQTGGSVVGAAGGNEWCFGGENSGAVNSFGYYELSGGTLTCPNNFQVGRYGKGVFYQSGGTNVQSGWCDTARYTGSQGITWLSGGLFQHIGTGTRYMIGESGRGEVTVSGTGVLETVAPLMMANGVSYLTLNGGTVRVPEIGKWSGTAYLNFNGGTLAARSDNPAFMVGNLAEAVVYGGNAIIDTAGYAISISQPLVAPAGNGVQNIPITDGGAGYMAPPIVQIDPSGSSGSALAVAQIDPVAGTVTNIVVTCSGYGYSVAPAVTLVGGGASTPATVGVPSLVAVSSGGLVKNGLGVLTLNGANTYSGPTVVNAGKLIATTAQLGIGAYSVASGAGLGVDILGANAQVNATTVALDAATLDFNVGNYGNPGFAPLNVSGALSVNGTITVGIVDALPQLGQFPLIKYGSRSGSGTFVLGSIPSGVVAAIVNNTANNSVDLQITAVSLPRWDGQAGGNWDIGLTTNWVELSTGLPALFAQGNAVQLDDSALGTTTVNLTGTVNPAKVTINNSALNYTIGGTGKITGSGGITKQGTGSLAIDTLNDYTGPTRIEGGKVAVTKLANGGQPSPIGSSSSAAANLVLANGALSYSGPAIAVDRGYSVQATNSSIDAQSDLGLSGPVTATAGSSFVKSGPAKLTYLGSGVKELSGGGFPGYNVLAGTLLFDGTGVAQTNHSQNEFWVGSTIDAPASIILSNTTLNVDSWFSIGRGNGTVGNLSTADLYNSTVRSGSASMGYDNGVAGNLARQTLTLNGTSAWTNNGDMNLGESAGSASTILVKDAASLYSGWRIHLGWHNGATGQMTIANSAALTINAWFSIGHEGGNGILNLQDTSRLWVLWDMNVTDVGTGDGLMNIKDTAQVSVASMFVGKGVASSGVVNQTGGAVLGRADGNELHIGFHGAGAWNMTAGSLRLDNHWFIVGRYTDGPGVLNVSGGIVNHNTTSGKLFRVGEDGTGILNISGTGSVTTISDRLDIGSNASGNGTVNLDGGSLSVRRVAGGAGTSAFNFNGGVLRALPNANVDFMSNIGLVNVLAGGAVIDTGVATIGITQALQDGSGNGGLTKLGTGTLDLNGVNTYTGPTLVSAGTLGGNGVINGSVTVAVGANLAPGVAVGTLSINNNLTLNGTTTMEVSKDGDVASSDLAAVSGALTMGGKLKVVVAGTNALAVNDTFNVFDWGTRSGSFTTTELPSGYTWDLSKLTTDGTIRVASIVAVSPVVHPPTVSGGKLIMTGTGGSPSGAYTWLTSTNVAAPAADWTTNSIGSFDATGAFSNAIPVNPSEPLRFFKMRVP